MEGQAGGRFDDENFINEVWRRDLEALAAMGRYSCLGGPCHSDCRWRFE